MYGFYMSDYKRNQVEASIARVLEPNRLALSSGLRTRLKRLLDTDRALSRVVRSSDPERARYAFYSGKPPGSGAEVLFSAYEAFALLIGLRIMAHGWPQRFAVRVMRRARQELETEHARILKDPAARFDLKESEKKTATLNNDRWILLTVVSQSEPETGAAAPFFSSVQHGYLKAVAWVRSVNQGAAGFTMFEVTADALRLNHAAAETKPSQRGRPG